MKKGLLIILAVISVISACKKDGDDKDYNSIRITSGTNSGYIYNFSPNLGFWAIANQTTKSYWLVFGDTSVPPVATTNVMDMFFYYAGENTIYFPSLEGQSMSYTLTIENETCNYVYKEATLNIYEITDEKIRGFISGEFHNSCGGTVTIEMDFEIGLQPA